MGRKAGVDSIAASLGGFSSFAVICVVKRVVRIFLYLMGWSGNRQLVKHNAW
jgi:hypothetical protein